MATIAFVLASDFEDSEFRGPYDALRGAGHEVEILGARAGEVVRGKRGKEQVKIEAASADRAATRYDALVIPGGYSPDHLRTDAATVRLVRDFAATGRPLAAICHGPQLLIEAGVVRGKTMTSWPSVRKDLENAGARWVDQEVAVDGALITSRKPEDIPAFARTILERVGGAARRPDDYAASNRPAAP